MNRLPTTTVAPDPDRGGWLATCSCSWRLWHIARPPVDAEAARHRATCATKRRG